MGERWNWTVLATKTGSEVSRNDAIRMSRQDVVGDRAETGVRRGIKMGDGGDETQMRMDTHRIRVVWGGDMGMMGMPMEMEQNAFLGEWGRRMGRDAGYRRVE